MDQQASKQYQALFDYATIGILITDATGEIVDMNALAGTLFQYRKEEIIGEKIEILIPESYRKTHVSYRAGFYHDPHNRVMGANRDLYARKKDDTTFPVEISLSHYLLEGKLFVIAFIIDITVRKNSEEMLIRQKKELEERTLEIRRLNVDLEKTVNDRTQLLKDALNELEHSKDELSVALVKEKELGDLKSRFVTMASHEFRTPLSTILSSADLIGKYTGNEQDKRDKHIKRIKDAVHNMKNILEDFLSLGKLEEGSVQARPEFMNDQDLVADVGHTISDMQVLVKAGQKIHFEEDVHGEIFTDPFLLRNILVNLISNAIKFSPEGVIITIEMKVIDNDLIVSVSDKGIGISKEDQQHLFERFFRAKNATNIQGTGLGLHIVAKYLELLNGNISLHSELGEGTTCIVTLKNCIRK